MDELTELAIKYKTDKWGKHHYTPVYYNLFKDRRESVKKVLEIGVGEGAGLKMWRDFFPNAVIHGADNDWERLRLIGSFLLSDCCHAKYSIPKVYGDCICDGCGKVCFPYIQPLHERIEPHYCDQSSKESFLELMDYNIETKRYDALYDVIIDDASHLLEDQVRTCLLLIQVLKKGGIYIIEDVADPYLFSLLDMYDCEMFKVGKRYDDRLIVVKHK